MGSNDAREMLEAAKEEMVRLETENADLRALMVELKPAEVLIEGSYFAVDELPTMLGNFMRLSDEYAREAKANYLRAERAEAVIAEAKLQIECDESGDAWRILATYQNGADQP